MKFYVVVNYYLVTLGFKSHEDPYPNVRAGVVNARTRDKSCAHAHLCTDLHKILNLRSEDSTSAPGWNKFVFTCKIIVDTRFIIAYYKINVTVICLVFGGRD